MRTYAIPIEELSGLPPDAPPGTRFDLWVAWDPPVTKRPKYQLLLKGVTLARITDPSSLGAPAAAVLLVTPAQMGDLLYGDRYGALSASVVSLADPESRSASPRP